LCCLWWFGIVGIGGVCTGIDGVVIVMVVYIGVVVAVVFVVAVVVVVVIIVVVSCCFYRVSFRCLFCWSRL